MSNANYKYSKLFEIGFIGTLEVKNRIIMSPMGTRFASEIGAVTPRMIDYYSEMANGGVGTVIVECASIDYPIGSGNLKNLTIYHNSYIAGHNELVESISSKGAKAILQLYHVGRNARPNNIKGMQPVAPSAIPCKFINVMPRELSTKEVEDIITKFVEAAVRAKTAGYDGIELHGAHGYLIGEFMSPSSNRRKDRYGGALNKRMAFPVEIVQGIKKELGSDYPLVFRISGDEFVDGGMNLEETNRAVKILEDAGVDALDVSAGTYDSMTATVEPMSYAQGWKIYLAEAIKSVVKIPIIGVGMIRKPEFAETILKDGRVDFVALGRALLADPYWPEKAKEGREKEIIPCISCNDGCLGGRVFKDLALRCTVNPLTGREGWRNCLAPTTHEKRVFIIGGGPAGMMAALTARKRGHRVVLYERSDQLGGQLRLAATPPGKEKITWFRDYLLNQIREQDIDVRLGQYATIETIIQGNPDVVIVASGATPLIPDVPGVRNRNVFTAWEVLEGKKQIRDKTVIIAGGGTVGCETALYLNSDNEVIIVEMLEDIAMDMEPLNRMDIISRIKESKIKVVFGREIVQIESDGVILRNTAKEEERLDTDAVVLAMGAIPLSDMAKELKGEIENVYVVGDSKRPRKIYDAVYEGFVEAMRI